MRTPEMEIADLLDRFTSGIRVQIARRQAAVGLTRFESLIMSLLLYARHRAVPATIDQLAQEVDLGRGQILDLLDRLCEKGYASRSGSQPTVWALTPEGHRKTLDLMQIAETLIAERTSEWRSQDLEELKGALEKVVRNAQTLGGA